MLIYITAISIAVIFSSLSERSLKKKKRRSAIVMSFLAVITPCLLAALRKPGVGIDSGTYAYTDFLIARSSSSFSSYLLRSSVGELFYPSLVYIISRVSKGFFWLFFISQILIDMPVYVSFFMIKGRRKDFSLAISYAAFLFLYYNLSLSIIRECIAISFIVLGYTLYKTQKKNRKNRFFVIALLVLAGLSHAFAIVVGPSIFFLDIIINDNKKETWKKGLIIVAIIAIVLNIKNIILLAAHLAPGYMSKYVNTFKTMNRSGLSTGDTIMKLVLLLACFLGTRKEHKYITDLRLSNFAFFGAIGFVFQFASIFSEYLLRISYYYQFFMIIPFGAFYNVFSQRDKKTGKIISIIMLFFYWYVVYVRWNWHGTMPYEFAPH